MKFFHLQLHRTHEYADSIIGTLSVNGELLCDSLELPWKDNQSQISCIPIDHYGARLRSDHPDQWRIELDNVPGRTHIQLHIGNFPANTQGCILVGLGYAANLVTQSTAAYDKLRAAFYGTEQPIATPLETIALTVIGTPG